MNQHSETPATGAHSDYLVLDQHATHQHMSDALARELAWRVFPTSYSIETPPPPLQPPHIASCNKTTTCVNRVFVQVGFDYHNSTATITYSYNHHCHKCTTSTTTYHYHLQPLPHSTSCTSASGVCAPMARKKTPPAQVAAGADLRVCNWSTAQS